MTEGEAIEQILQNIKMRHQKRIIEKLQEDEREKINRLMEDFQRRSLEEIAIGRRIFRIVNLLIVLNIVTLIYQVYVIYQKYFPANP